MATDAATLPGSRTGGPTRPYAPSWVDVLVNALAALPGPTWAAYGLLAAGTAVYLGAQAWAAGSVPTLDWSANAFWLVYPIALFAYLDRAAVRAWTAFRPAVDIAADEEDAIRYELTTAPRRPALLLTVIGVAFPIVGYVADPVGQHVAGIAPLPLAMRALLECTAVSITLVVVLQMSRQLRIVSRLHARAVRINILRPGPAYAFAQLTVRAGAGILGIVVWQVLLLQVEQEPPAAQYFLASGLAIAVATLAFLLPLMGMQHRLASEKARLADSVNSRIEAAMARNHDAMDAGNLAEADQLGKMFATLTQERDLHPRRISARRGAAPMPLD